MRTIYKSRIDWWIWAIMLFCLVVVFVIGITSPWWVTLIYGILILGSLASIFGIWYVIDGDSLIIYRFFRPCRYPINKIKEIKYCRGILSNPALSTRRLAVRFTDRSILKSSLPLEISPKDRDAFIKNILEVNPEIRILERPL